MRYLKSKPGKSAKKTLGYFLSELHNRADLDEHFDVLLEAFLEERNILVHSVDDIPGWNLSTVEGRKIARAFVDSFIRKTVEIQKIFLGLMRAWQEEAGFDVPVPVGLEPFAEIDAEYKTRVDDLFFEKES